MEFELGMMELDIKVIGKTIKCMDQVNFFMLMVIYIKV